MMGLIGMGNNPMVGATVAVAVSIEEAAKAGKFQETTYLSGFLRVLEVVKSSEMQTISILSLHYLYTTSLHSKM